MARPQKTLLAAATAALLWLGACGESDDPRGVVRIDPATAAVVNGDPVFISDVELEALAQGIIQRGDAFGPDHPDFGRILDQLIDQRLLAPEASRRGLDQDEQSPHREKGRGAGRAAATGGWGSPGAHPRC